MNQHNINLVNSLPLLPELVRFVNHYPRVLRCEDLASKFCILLYKKGHKNQGKYDFTN